MDNQITLKKAKDAFPLASIFLALYVLLIFTTDVTSWALRLSSPGNLSYYFGSFEGLIYSLADIFIPNLLTVTLPSLILLVIIVLLLFKVRGPALATPFVLWSLVSFIGIFQSLSYFIAKLIAYRGFSNMRDLVSSISYDVVLMFYPTVFFIAVVLLTVAAFKSKRCAKSKLPTIAAILFLAHPVIRLINIFISHLVSYYFSYTNLPGGDQILQLAWDNTLYAQFYYTPNLIYNIMTLIAGIVLAVGVYFLGLWMAKGKPQVEEENAIVE